MSKYSSPYLEIYEPLHIDDSIESFEYIEYQPTNSNDMNKPNHEIITTDENVYLLPHKALIEVRGRLQKSADNSNYDTTDNISLVNNGWSLFSNFQYYLGKTPVENIQLYVGQASTIINLVQYSDDYGKSTASNMFWYKDSGKGGTDMTEYQANANLLPVAGVGNGDALNGANFRTNFKILRNSNYNNGFMKRQEITTGNKEICMMLPLASISSFCRDINSAFIGLPHKLILNRTDPEDYIMRANGVAAGKFNISHISLWMPKIEPSLGARISLEEKMAQNVLRDLFYNQMTVYRSQFNATVTRNTWRITGVSGTELPTHIFIAFQSTERDKNQEQNNMVFDNAKVTSINVNINTKQYPESKVECDFSLTNRNCSRAYMYFQEACNKYSDCENGSQISIDDFANLYPIFHFDVSKRDEGLKTSQAEIKVSWNLSGNFRNLADNADVGYHVYAVMLCERYLKLNIFNKRMMVLV